MAVDTRIEWCDATWDHVRGCTRVSEGCRHCYAETLSKRNPLTLGVWGPRGTRVVAAEAAWRQPVKWNRLAAAGRLPDGSPNPDGHRPRVFCASMADVFEEWAGPMSLSDGDELRRCPGCGRVATRPVIVSEFSPAGAADDGCPACGADTVAYTMDDVRRRLFALIDATPNLDWLLVTKRPQHMERMICEAGYGAAWPFHNVWLGVSVENQAAADERIPWLIDTPAAIRFLSCEPLLEGIDISRWLATGKIHWVITGGES